MEKLSFDEIKELIKNLDEFDRESGPEQWMLQDVSAPNEPGPEQDIWDKIGEYEMVEHFGGEGQGDDYWTVYHFIDHGIHINFIGRYSSWNGADYEYMAEVKPVQKMVTVYE